jgi:hypothetical protein
VLRTRCLECESLTERREDFQDISVPVQEDELSKVEESSESKRTGGEACVCRLRWLERPSCSQHHLLILLANL